jgi:hypothetical protein
MRQELPIKLDEELWSVTTQMQLIQFKLPIRNRSISLVLMWSETGIPAAHRGSYLPPGLICLRF